MKMNVNNDATGNRISKTVTNKNTTDGTDKFVTTYYMRDPQGNVLAVYEHKHGDSGNGTFTLTEQHLYGAGRLGMKKRDLALNVANASEPTPVTHYELTNHLGNVMAVISDEASTTDEPTVVSLSDYYPYGMTEPGRNWNAGDYRFGYTGHEKENDLAEGVYTTEYRLLDARLGRWMSVDPAWIKYPDLSSYNYCEGNPMMFVDQEGESPISVFAKYAAKAGLKTAAKKFVKQNIEKRLGNYMSKNMMKQFAKDVDQIVDILDDSPLELALEFIPVFGDIYGASKFGKKIATVYKKLQDLENKYVKKIDKSLEKDVKAQKAFREKMRSKGVRDARRDQAKGVDVDGVKYEKGKNVDGHHKESVSKHPEKMTDPRNVKFMKEEDHIKYHREHGTE